MIQVLKEFISPSLAVIAGLYAFRYLNLFWKSNLFLTLFYLVVLSLAYVITPLVLINPNGWIYNIYIFIETFSLCIVSFFIVKPKITRMIIVFLLLFFVTIYAISIYHSGVQSFANYALVSGSMNISIIYCYVLYSDFRKTRLYWWQSPVFWFSIGIVIYFSCMVPYMSLYNFLNENYPQVSKLLFQIINDLLANVRYLCLAIAFWLIRRNALNPVTSAR